MKNKKLSLVRLHQKELEKKRYSFVLGGGTPGNCGCGCHGSSTTCDNSRANWNEGLHSPGVKPVSCPYDPKHPYEVYAFFLGLEC